MFETYRARRQQRLAEVRLSTARAMVAQQSLTVKSNFISEDLQAIREAQSAFDRSVGPMFDLLNYPTADAIDEGSDQIMVRQVNKMYATDPYVHGWIDLLVNFIVGSECQIMSRDNDRKRQDAAQDVLDEFYRGRAKKPGVRRVQSPWPRVAAEFVRRCLREGRSAMPLFVGDDGKVFTRFLNPVYLRNTGQYGEYGSFGVVTDEQDVQNVKLFTYWPWQGTYQPGRGLGEPVEFDAEDVIFGKVGDDDCKVGRPIILSLLQNHIDRSRLLFAVLKQSLIRSLVAREEIYSGLSQKEIDAIHDRLKAEERNASGQYEKIPVAGSTDRHGGKVEVNYKAPNMQHSDQDYIFRRLALADAVALGLTEGMVSGDDKQQNYHGGEIGEAKAIRTIKGWQTFFYPYFETVGSRVIYEAKRHGALDPATDEGVQIDFPLIVERDVLKATQAVTLQLESGIIDMRTARIDLNRDPEAIEENLEMEKAGSDEHNTATARDELTAALRVLTPAKTNGNGDRTAN